jgi:hypothetical protein
VETGGVTNAEKILHLLDRQLNQPVELTIYGRAAIQLGYDNPPAEYATSLDVDVVLWIGQAEELMRSGNFWEAVESVNRQLSGEGLYISHFFEETQVILRPDWLQHRMPLAGDWKRLLLYRLGDADLLLSKLMRDDPQDLKDSLFICAQRHFTSEDVERFCRQARVPPVQEVEEHFAIMKNRLLKKLTGSADKNG